MSPGVRSGVRAVHAIGDPVVEGLGAGEVGVGGVKDRAAGEHRGRAVRRRAHIHDADEVALQIAVVARCLNRERDARGRRQRRTAGFDGVQVEVLSRRHRVALALEPPLDRGLVCGADRHGEAQSLPLAAQGDGRRGHDLRAAAAAEHVREEQRALADRGTLATHPAAQLHLAPRGVARERADRRVRAIPGAAAAVRDLPAVRESAGGERAFDIRRAIHRGVGPAPPAARRPQVHRAVVTGDDGAVRGGRRGGGRRRNGVEISAGCAITVGTAAVGTGASPVTDTVPRVLVGGVPRGAGGSSVPIG